MNKYKKIFNKIINLLKILFIYKESKESTNILTEINNELLKQKENRDRINEINIEIIEIDKNIDRLKDEKNSINKSISVIKSPVIPDESLEERISKLKQLLGG